MKHLKKALVLVLALAVMLAMSTTVFAAPDMTTYRSSVTATNIDNGNVLKLYKLADAVIGDNNVISYNWDSQLPAEYDSEEEINAANVQTLADKLGAIYGGTDADYTSDAAAGNTVTIANVDPGWYFAIVSGTANTGVVYKNMLINTTPTVKGGNWQKTDVSVEVKKTTETITKGVGGNPDHNAEVDTTDGYSVGDKVPYEIKTNIPNYPADSKVATFVITDSPTSLTDDYANAVVTVAGDDETGTAKGSISGKFTVAQAGDGFTITFDKDYILAHPGAAVTVNYEATIKDDAVIAADGKTAENTAKIKFNPNPHEDETVEPSDKTEDYTYGVNVYKYENGDKAKKLTGAKFILYKADGTTQAGAEKAVDANGYVSWNGLEAGTYKLVETQAPSGYKLDSTPKEVVISKDTAKGDDRVTNATETNFIQVDVPNTPGTSLPSTGGIGTTLFYIIGGILVVGAAVLLIARRRLRAK